MPFSRIHPLGSSPERLRQLSRESPWSKSIGSDIEQFSFIDSPIEFEDFWGNSAESGNEEDDSWETVELETEIFGEIGGSIT